LQGHLSVEFGPSGQLRGVYATAIVSSRGTFARFEWADWPSKVAQAWAERVAGFEVAHGLERLREGSAEWNAIFHGRRGDPESAEQIARIFLQHFHRRVSWVMCSRDSRGRIGAQVNLTDSEGREGDVQVGLELSWKDANAFGIGGEDLEAMRSAINEVSEWAGRRVRSPLNTLRDRLKTLYGDRFRGLYVFGSYAKPDAGIELPEDSDLDVALILSDFENAYDEIKRFSRITSDLSLEHGLVISVVPLREADYRDGRTNFTRVISEYAIPVE